MENNAPVFQPSQVKNKLLVLAERRLVNARNQLANVLLESFELFGPDFTRSVIQECNKIFDDYEKTVGSDNIPKRHLTNE